MRQVLLFAAWAWVNADACASCQGKAWTRRSGNDNNNDNNDAISLNLGGIFERFPCGIASPSHADMGKRAAIKNDCSQQDVIENALRTCVQYAEAGAKEANNKESPLFEFFFKKENDGKRSEVAGQFQAIANECRATQGGAISVTCKDGAVEQCSDTKGREFTAWAQQKLGSTPGRVVQLCRAFFGGLPGGCGQLDQPGVIVHEFSHAIVGTDDMSGGYGLAAVRKLSPDENINHADTWALFAQAASLGCTTEQLRQAPQGAGLSPGQGTGSTLEA